jgi:hypothetical protein
MRSPMSVSRREFLVAGLGLAVAGCTEYAADWNDRPQPQWTSGPTTPSGQRVHAPAPQPPVATPPAPAPAPGGLQIIPRAQWAKAAPIMPRINPMRGINRITVHHEGWTAVWFSDYASTAARIESDRRTHVSDRGWGDIGYHYIIDRAGRVWEGRNVAYQGAHVKANNENNLGIMLLGNFDYQEPTSAQQESLRRTVAAMMRQYRVPVSRVYTHQEIQPTRCPGQLLQPRFVAMRRNGHLA